MRTKSPLIHKQFLTAVDEISISEPKCGGVSVPPTKTAQQRLAVSSYANSPNVWDVWDEIHTNQ